MKGVTIFAIIGVYFSVLWFISYLVGRKYTNNDAFFLGNKQSPWWLVAIGMVGSSISGVSLVSVPGMVGKFDFSYMQTVFGFFVGYIIIANVLLPLYYRLNLTSIYTYLENRFGKYSYKTGALFFLISRIIGSGVRLYLVTLILQKLVFDVWHVPFLLTTLASVFLIWLYTHRSGIKTIVWTDTLQTICLISALVLMIVQVSGKLNLNIHELFETVATNSHSRIFVFDDWHSHQYFFKQFFSGIFIAIAMTGLDQDMMQKNLTCKNLKDAKKNMYWYGISFIPLNLLFLTLGAMMLLLGTQNNINLPLNPDEILPFFASGYLGATVSFLFIIGLIAATFASSDSALASLTTSYCVDILEVKKDEPKTAERKRKYTHIGMSLVLIFVVLCFKALNNRSIIDAIYTVVSYTYGPLLGMFGFGLFVKQQVNDRFVPYVALASPLICYALNQFTNTVLNYSFGYELLILNGLITFAGMWLIRTKKISEEIISDGD